MCDYSLELYRSRPARMGERYVTHCFPTGSIGLAAVGDRSTAVCVAPDMRLRLQELPKGVQDWFNVGPEADVSFVRLDREPNRYRDAVKFDNGVEVLLQDIGSGVTVIVTASLEDRAVHRKAMAWV